MSPKKMIGLSFAAAAAKLYEVFDKQPAAGPVSGLALRRIRRRDRQGELRREIIAVAVRDEFAAE